MAPEKVSTESSPARGVWTCKKKANISGWMVV